MMDQVMKKSQVRSCKSSIQTSASRTLNSQTLRHTQVRNLRMPRSTQQTAHRSEGNVDEAIEMPARAGWRPSFLSPKSFVKFHLRGLSNRLSNSPTVPCAAATRPPVAAAAKQLRAGEVLSLIPGRLSFAMHSSTEMTRRKIDQEPGKFYFSSDCQDLYEPFCADFGPVNLLTVHKFCDFMREYWYHPSLQAGRELVYYTDEAINIRTNAAFLLAAFMMVELHYTPEAAWAPFTHLAEDSFATFRDATFCPQDYHLTVLACLQGLSKAIECGFYNPETFDAEEFAHLDNPITADMHMVCPKFIAFKGPKGNRGDGREKEMYTFTPEHYSSVFEYMGVSAIVRLNEADTYDRAGFTNFGFNHHDLYFDDCTVPSEGTVAEFLDMCERETGVVAVHCKAGLGRTGTLIAIYLMKHFGFTASECIGWLRIVRPGSVIGPQQQYLHYAEALYRFGKSEPGRSGLSQPLTQEDRAVTSDVRTSAHRAQSAESQALGILVADAQKARAARRSA